MNNEIESRLQKIIDEKEELVFLKGKFNTDADIAGMGINSLMFIKLIIEIENEFDMEFDDDDLDMENLNTFGDLIKYIDIHVDDTINE